MGFPLPCRPAHGTEDRGQQKEKHMATVTLTPLPQTAMIRATDYWNDVLGEEW
jgi:hypothetical protein